MPADTRSRELDRAGGGWWESAGGWIIGTAATVVFYAVLPYLPIDQHQAWRYFCSHWITYATTWLFFVGMTGLLFKAKRLPRERRAVRDDMLEGLSASESMSAVEMADRMEQTLRLTAKPFLGTFALDRLRSVVAYLRGKRTDDGLEGHLAYLADMASGRLHDTYALIRTITWAIPILGFLGTVIGITMAIANITPDQLESSLGEVTAGLAVAFDTTALSLGLSMVLVFSTFVVERAEQGVLDRLEDFGLRRLLELFPHNAERPADPLLNAQAEAAQQLLTATQRLADLQLTNWQAALDDWRSGFRTSVERQQLAVEQELAAGFAETLASHSQQLAQYRSEMLQGYQQTSSTLMLQLAENQAAMRELEQRQIDRWESARQSFEQRLTESERASDARLDRTAAAFQESVGQWIASLAETNQLTQRQLDELRDQRLVLLKISEETNLLGKLEDNLSRNLESVRVAESLEETMHNLNAAVHLLTSRTKPKAA